MANSSSLNIHEVVIYRDYIVIIHFIPGKLYHYDIIDSNREVFTREEGFYSPKPCFCDARARIDRQKVNGGSGFGV